MLQSVALTQVEGYFRKLKVLQNDIIQYNKDVAIKGLCNDKAVAVKGPRKSKFGFPLFSPSKQENSNNLDNQQPQPQPPQVTPNDTDNKPAKRKVKNQDLEISLIEFKPGVRNSQ